VFCKFLEQLLVDTLRLLKLSSSESSLSDVLFTKKELKFLQLSNRCTNGDDLVALVSSSFSTLSYVILTSFSMTGTSKMMFSSLDFSFLEELPLLNSLFKVSFIVYCNLNYGVMVILFVLFIN
jgi:hypothetical protein